MAAVCTEVSPLCPVEATTLGYYPNKPLNIFIAAAFGLAALISLVLGVWKRTWVYTGFLVAGCVLELAGYAARVALNANPWNEQAFETQICAIILAPTIICISMYLSLKHITVTLNPSLSRVPPARYPYLFIPADVSCLVVQAVGGSLAAQGHKNLGLLRAGNRVIIVGIALQVVVLLAFGGMSLDYYLRVRKWLRNHNKNEEKKGTEQELVVAAQAWWRNRRFRLFCGAVLGAYAAVQIRCIYRIAEFAGGWGNPIMQDQPSFTVLDSFMMLIVVYLLACFPQGVLFPHDRKAVAAAPVASSSLTHHGESSTEEAKVGDEAQDTSQGPSGVLTEAKDMPAVP